MTSAYAPGRVNLIGEHTDYTGGYVLPMAVDMGVTCHVTRRDDTIVTATSSAKPGERVQADMQYVKPGDVTGWAAYVIGTAGPCANPVSRFLAWISVSIRHCQRAPAYRLPLPWNARSP